MANLDDIKNEILKMFPKKVLKKSVGDYGFNFDNARKIEVISYATNLTPFTIKKSADLGADLLITHHDAWKFLGKERECCYEMLQDNKLNHCFFHSPLDAAEFGTSASLADALGLQNQKRAVEYAGLLVGISGNIQGQLFQCLLEKCESVLDEKVRSFKNNDNVVSKVLIITGGGCDTEFLDEAKNLGCDTYITGEYSMYMQHYAEFLKINMIIGSHTRTEIIGVRAFVNKLKAIFNDIKTHEIIEPSY